MAAVIVLAIGFACGIRTSHADNPAPIPLAKGTLLAAGAHIADPRFRESIIVITDHSSAGTAGLIINHPTQITVTHALAGIKELMEFSDAHLYVGGPIAFDEIFILTRSSRPQSIQHVFADVYFGRGVDALRQQASRLDALHSLRVFIGYVGWIPGQLEDEVQHGDWIVMPPDNDAIFTTSPQVLWERFIKNWSGQWL